MLLFVISWYQTFPSFCFQVLGDLPQKREETCLCTLNTAQSQLYRSFVSTFAAEQNENSGQRLFYFVEFSSFQRL